MNKIIMLLPLLTGCPVAHTPAAQQSFPDEDISCTHPDSQYEAAVEVSVKDKTKWSNLEFHIYQDTNHWQTNLYNSVNDPELWQTKMQLYELDCTEEYNYDVDYN